MTVGSPARRTKQAAASVAPEAATPPPRRQMGRLDSASMRAAWFRASVAGASRGSGPPGSGRASRATWAVCTSLGMSTSTGPGRPEAAMRKASGMIRASSPAERTRKLCLVTGMLMP